MELTKKLVENDKHLLVTYVVSKTKVADINRIGLIPASLEHNIRIHSLNDKIPATIDIDPGPNHKRDVKLAMDPALKFLFDTMPIASASEPLDIVDFHAIPLMNPFFEPVQAVISDCFVGLPAKLCQERGIPCYLFSTASGITIPLFNGLTDEVPVESDESYYRPCPPGSLILQESMKQFLLFTKDMIRLSSGIVINSFRDLEPDAVEAITNATELKDIPVYFIGPLLHTEASETDEKNEMVAEVTEWLDSKEEHSVIYVSFGSMVFPSASQLVRIATALLALRRPFIWSLRSSQQNHLPVDMRKKIVRQFSSTDNGDFLILPWVSQATVLAHPAVKVFVSHCGWNGLLETISAGVPVVGFPLYGDQTLNGKLLQERGIGLVIPGTSLLGEKVIDSNEIAGFIEKVSGWTDESEDKRFSEAAQALSEKAAAAMKPFGDSVVDFKALVHQIFNPHYE